MQVKLYENKFISKKLYQAIQTFISQFKLTEPSSSRLQKEIFNNIKNRFKHILFQEEYFIEYTHVDIAWPPGKLSIQVNGPCHYFAKKLNLSSQFNTHLLEKLGWTVVHFPYDEWNENLNKKKEYLDLKLKKLLPHYSTNNPTNTRDNSLLTTASSSTDLSSKKPNKKGLGKKISLLEKFSHCNIFSLLDSKENCLSYLPTQKGTKKGLDKKHSFTL